MAHRVVITAVGVVSPIGADLETFSQNLLGGWSGVRLLDHIFGDDIDSVEPRYGAPAVDFPIALDAGPQLHRSVLFGDRAIRQIVDSAGDLPWNETSLCCGVGIGQQLPELIELTAAAERWRLDLIERLAQPASLTVLNRLSSDFGTNWLRQRYELAPNPKTFAGACAAATQACIQAFEDIALGADMAIAGAHDSLLSTLGLYVMHGLGTLATSHGNKLATVRPFDTNREGILIGEGACYFLFEEREHALRRCAPILAEMKGCGSSLDGYHVTSPDPSGDAAVRMIRDALTMANLEPEAVDYVNAHGTGTLANDQVEANILKRVFGAHRPPVSSTKPQVGHLIAACGAIELLACIVAINKQQVPPNLNCTTQDPDCDINVARGFAEPRTIRNVLCNSFGFGGQNACLVLGAHT